MVSIHIREILIIGGLSVLLSNKQMIGLVVVGFGASWYLKNKAAETVKEVGAAIDPTSSENIFYSGVNSVGSTLTGDEDFSLGGWIYEVAN